MVVQLCQDAGSECVDLIVRLYKQLMHVEQLMPRWRVAIEPPRDFTHCIKNLIKRMTQIHFQLQTRAILYILAVENEVMVD